MKQNLPDSALKLHSAYKLILLLEKMAMLNQELGISELSMITGIAKSTIHRFLQMLVDCGYVKQNSTTGKYFLTLKLFTIGSCVLDRFDIIKVVHPFMLKLNNEFDETVNLVVFDNDKNGIYIKVEESKKPIRLHSRLGNKVPLYCSAVGKVLISEWPMEKLRNILEGINWQQYTPKTITSFSQLMTELEKVRKQGLAFDYEELTVGVMCVAVPIRDHSKEIIAALSIAGPIDRIKKREDLIVSCIKKIGNEISHYLGYNEFKKEQ